MRLPGSTEVARVAPLLVALFLCLGVFLYPHQLASPASGPSFSPGVAVGHASHGGVSGKGHTLSVGSLSVPIEEADPGSKSPVNAADLTALLLTVFVTVFGAGLGLLYGGWMWSKKVGLLLAERRVPAVTGSPTREPAPSLLSVFIL